MSSPISRRTFVGLGAVGAMGLLLPARGFSKVSPNEKLNLGVIGVSGRGGDNLHEVMSENIVALCDVDSDKLKAAAAQCPGAKTYSDFRALIDQKDIDAIVVSTPDHTHAVVAIAGLKSGRHVYCEKPLTRTVSECRALIREAHERKLVTQMGTQIHATNNYRRVVELIKCGAIGKVSEVHVWASAVYGGRQLPKAFPPVPAALNFDLWLGPVDSRPYSPEYVPAAWRNWWAFGGGCLSDFGCHYMDLPFWALDLKHPTSVEVLDGPAPDPESPPVQLTLRYAFPRRGELPPVELTWYQGGRRPAIINSFAKEDLADRFGSGVLFMGDKGQLIADYNWRVLLPEPQYKDFKAPAESIAASIGHHKEWIQAIKTGGTTTCNFDYSGPLAESVLLGSVAFRAGGSLTYDATKGRATDNSAAEQYIQHHYRSGWKL